jgi:hypothetical protein
MGVTEGRLEANLPTKVHTSTRREEIVGIAIL